MGINKYTKTVPIDTVDLTGVSLFVNALDKRAKVIDENYNKMQTYIDSTLGSVELIKESDKQAYQAKVNAIVEEINKTSNQDLTNIDNFRNLQTKVQETFKDGEVQNILQNNAYGKQILEERAKVMGNPQLMKEGYSQVMDNEVLTQLDEWIKTPGKSLGIQHYLLKDKDLEDLDVTLSKIPQKIIDQGVGDGDLAYEKLKFISGDAIKAAITPIISKSQEYQIRRKQYFQSNPQDYQSSVSDLTNYIKRYDDNLKDLNENLRLAGTEEAKQTFQAAINQRLAEKSQLTNLLKNSTEEEVANHLYDLNFINNKITQHGQVEKERKLDAIDVARQKINRENAIFEYDKFIDDRDYKYKVQNDAADRELEYQKNNLAIAKGLGNDKSSIAIDIPIVNADVQVSGDSVLYQNLERIDTLTNQSRASTKELLKVLEDIVGDDGKKQLAIDLQSQGINIKDLESNKVVMTSQTASLMSKALRKVQENSGTVTTMKGFQSAYEIIGDITDLNNQITVAKLIHSDIMKQVKAANPGINTNLTKSQIKEIDESYNVFNKDKNLSEEYEKFSKVASLSSLTPSAKAVGIASYNKATGQEKIKGQNALIGQALAGATYLTDQNKSIYYPTTSAGIPETKVGNKKLDQSLIGKGITTDRLEVINYDFAKGTIAVKIKNENKDTKATESYVEGGKIFYVDLDRNMNNQFKQSYGIDESKLVDPKTNIDNLVKAGALSSSALAQMKNLVFYLNPIKLGLPQGLMLKYEVESINNRFYSFNLHTPLGVVQIQDDNINTFEKRFASYFLQGKQAFPDMSDNDILKNVIKQMSKKD